MVTQQPISESATLNINGLVVASEFPLADFEAVHDIISSKNGQADLYQHFVAAWSAFAYRYRACQDSAALIANLIAKYGPNPEPEHRYAQEHALFDFYGSGFSVFECAFFAIFSVCAMLQPSNFPMTANKDLQRITPRRTRDAVKQYFPDDSFVTEIDLLFEDSDFKRLRDLRNVLTHRTAPGRRMYVGLDDFQTVPTEWKLTNNAIDSAFISREFQDLARLAGDLVAALRSFVHLHYKQRNIWLRKI